MKTGKTQTQRFNELGQPIGPPLDSWTPRSRPLRTSMTGCFCRLEPMMPERHAAQLYDAFGKDTEGRNWTYLFADPFTSFESFNHYLLECCCSDDPLFYTIIDEVTDKAVGMASLMRIDPVMGVIEVGHINFSPLMQRSPVATEAMFLMMQRVFDELGYRRYEWKCDNNNAPSKRAAKRLGFSFEGIFRQAVIYKGRSRDTAWFSIIDKEWPQQKQAFQKWLNSENFDADGVQKSSLQDFRK